MLFLDRFYWIPKNMLLIEMKDRVSSKDIDLYVYTYVICIYICNTCIYIYIVSVNHLKCHWNTSWFRWAPLAGQVSERSRSMYIALVSCTLPSVLGDQTEGPFNLVFQCFSMLHSTYNIDSPYITMIGYINIPYYYIDIRIICVSLFIYLYLRV